MRELLAPITFADSTYASALIRTASERMTRKYCGMYTTVIEIAAAMIPPHRLDWPPLIAIATTMASSSDGKAKTASQDHDEHPVEPAAEVAADETEEDPDEDRQDDRDDDHEDRGLRTPEHARIDVVAAYRRAPDVRAARRLLRAERAAGIAQLRETVRGDQRSEDRDEDEQRRDDETGDEHAALQADALPELVDDRNAVEEAALGRRRSGDCWSGWVAWSDMSVPHSRVDEGRDDVDDEVRQGDDHGEKGDHALHGHVVAGLQVLRRAGNRDPSIRRSSRSAPRRSSRIAICRPMTVMIGMRAGLYACRRTSRYSLTPRERAAST